MYSLQKFLVALLVALAPTSLLAQVADINFGSAAATGGAFFQGTDGNSADSITLGYFDATANAALTGWNALVVDSDFNTTTGFNIGAVTNFDVAAASGKAAWILVTDGVLNGLVRANDWVNISGSIPPAPTTQLVYQLDTNDSTSTVTTLGNVIVTDSAGQGGTGILVAVAVPEPGTYALILGALALTWVALRRRTV